MGNFKDNASPERVPFWLDPKKRAILFQFLTFCMVGLLAYYLVSNVLINLQKQKIATGFGFLRKEASFEIGESLISYSAASTYGRALLVGALNTIKVAFIGVVITIILGTIIGVARLSTNWLVSKLATIYVEVMQDIPVLLQLFFWYAIFYETLPSPQQALNPGAGIYMSNRGVAFTIPEAHPAHKYMLLAFLVGCVIVYVIRRWARKRQERTGQLLPDLSRRHSDSFRPAFHHLVGLRHPSEDGCPQTRWIQLRRRVNGQSRVHRPSDGPDPVYGRLRGRGGPGRDPVGEQRSKGSSHVHWPQTYLRAESCDPASGPQGHRSPPDQPDAQPDKKQLPGRGHWISGLCFRGQHDHESDRSIH